MAETINSSSNFTARTSEIGGQDAFHYVWVHDTGAFVAKLVSAAAGATDAVVPAGYRRKDTPANVSDADNDYDYVQGSDGALWTMNRPVVSAGAYQQLTVSTTAVALTVPGGSRYALIRVSAMPVRFRDDGTNPTSALGMPLNTGDSIEYDGPLSALRFIRSGASDATLDILYYK